LASTDLTLTFFAPFELHGQTAFGTQREPAFYFNVMPRLYAGLEALRQIGQANNAFAEAKSQAQTNSATHAEGEIDKFIWTSLTQESLRDKMIWVFPKKLMSMQ
jgi:hypothetical protein